MFSIGNIREKLRRATRRGEGVELSSRETRLLYFAAAAFGNLTKDVDLKTRIKRALMNCDVELRGDHHR